MNLNDRRLGAYNKTLKGGSSSDIAGGAPGKTVGAADPAAKKTSVHQNGSEPRDVEPAPRARASVPLPGLVKVPGAGPGSKENPYRKVAKFLLLIGVEEAAKIMAKLTGEQTEKVVLELSTIRRVDKDEAAVVLAEFDSLLKQAREPTGGVETARTILESAFGKERAAEMLRKAVPNANGKPFDYLEGVDSDRVYRLLADELPAIKALVLSQMRPRAAADVIQRMGAAEKNETVLRLAKLKTMDPEIVRRVDAAMREKVEAVRTSSDEAVDGRSALADILRHMDGASETSILRGLSESDPDLGKDLRDRLFTVDDIVHADDRYLQDALRPLSDRDISALLAGKGEPFREKILANVSRTRGALVLDEERNGTAMTRSESERVTGAFFARLRRAWESGELFVSGRDEKEEWV